MPAPSLLLANILGFWHWVIILVIILLLFGSSRLPDLMRSLGRSVTEFKKGISEGASEDEETPKKVEKP